MVEMSQRIENLVEEEVEPERRRIQSIYYTLGIPIDLFAPIFAVSRISGWTAQCLSTRTDPGADGLHRPGVSTGPAAN